MYAASGPHQQWYFENMKNIAANEINTIEAHINQLDYIVVVQLETGLYSHIRHGRMRLNLRPPIKHFAKGITGELTLRVALIGMPFLSFTPHSPLPHSRYQ